MKKVKRVAILISLTLSFSLHAATFEINQQEWNPDYGQGVKGAVNDTLFYTIGGGTVQSQPPTRFLMEQMGIGFGWKADLMCGNFDLQTSVKNQLNGVTAGFKNLMSNVITSATGAVASLPAMVLQRANPGLYEMLTNGMLQANVAFDKAQFNCQNMSNKLADYTLSNKWTHAAVAEEYKSAISSMSDGIAADQRYQQATGKDGINWIGGQRRGGAGQPAIKPTHDITKTGFNILNKLPVTSNNSIPSSSCSGAICQKYQSSEEAAKAVVKVLGDRSIRTCKEGNSCSSGGLENEPGTSVAGTGFSIMLDEITKDNFTTLVKLVNGELSPNNSNLAKLQSGDLAVTRGVIQALKDDPDNFALVQRLAGELAMAETVSTALLMRRMIVAGLAEPNVAEQNMAQEEADRRLEFLDKEIQALRNEMELRKAISNNALLTTLTRQQDRQEEHRLQQRTVSEDQGFGQLRSPQE